MEMKKTEIAMGGCSKSDLENVGEVWENDRRNWRLLTENVQKEKK